MITATCGNCGHGRDEHNEQGDCRAPHRWGGYCVCHEFIPMDKATPEMRARLLFGTQFHSVYSFREPFSAGAPCHHRDCVAQAERRIMVNVWGSVVEYDVCEDHASQYHGKMLDDFPARRAGK